MRAHIDAGHGCKVAGLFADPDRTTDIGADAKIELRVRGTRLVEKKIRSAALLQRLATQASGLSCAMPHSNIMSSPACVLRQRSLAQQLHDSAADDTIGEIHPQACADKSGVRTVSVELHREQIGAGRGRQGMRSSHQCRVGVAEMPAADKGDRRRGL
jgi:hypothetical protein